MIHFVQIENQLDQSSAVVHFSFFLYSDMLYIIIHEFKIYNATQLKNSPASRFLSKLCFLLDEISSVEDLSELAFDEICDD